MVSDSKSADLVVIGTGRYIIPPLIEARPYY